MMARLTEEDLERALGAAGAAGYTVDLVAEIRRLRSEAAALRGAFDRTAYAIFQSKRMTSEDAQAHLRVAYDAACEVLNAEATEDSQGKDDGSVMALAPIKHWPARTRLTERDLGAVAAAGSIQIGGAPVQGGPPVNSQELVAEVRRLRDLLCVAIDVARPVTSTELDAVGAEIEAIRAEASGR